MSIRDSGRQGVVTQSIFAFAVKGLGAIAAFVVNLVLARILGAEQSGYFFLAFTVMTFLGALTRCGFDNVVLRHTAAAKASEDWRSVRQVFVRCASVSFAVSACIAIFLWIGSGFLAGSVFNKPDFQPVLAAISPAIITFGLLWLLAYSLQGMGHVSSAIIAMSVAVNIVLIIVVWSLGVLSGEGVAWVYSLSSVFVFAGFLVFWHMKTSVSVQKATYRVSWSSMFASAWPLWIVLLMSQLILWAGQFVGGVYLPPEEIAQLAVAQRTALLVSFILTAVNMVVAPRFASLYASGDMNGLRNMALTAVRFMALAAMPVLAIMLIFPGFWMGLFGEGFYGGAILLQVLVVGQFINVLTGSVGYLLTMSGHERDLRNTLLIVAPVSVVITLILVPVFGAIGAALSTALAVSVQNVIGVYWVKRRLGFNTLAVWRTKSV